MRLFLNTSLLSHTVLLGMKTSKYLAKSRNAKTLDYHQNRFTFSRVKDLHSPTREKVTGLISVSGPSSLCDQREFPGHCHSLLIDDTDKNPFDANYLQNMFFTLCNFTS